MRAATVGALTPLPLASSANCFFHASKPAAVPPHFAAPASLAINTSTTKAATVTVLNCPPLVIQNSFRPLPQAKCWLAIPAEMRRDRGLSRPLNPCPSCEASCPAGPSRGRGCRDCSSDYRVAAGHPQWPCVTAAPMKGSDAGRIEPTTSIGGRRLRNPPRDESATGERGAVPLWGFYRGG